MVQAGHVTAILDWETAGWLPEYWEFPTGCRLQSPTSWWYKLLRELSEGQYKVEYEGEQALSQLTGGSYAG